MECQWSWPPDPIRGNLTSELYRRRWRLTLEQDPRFRLVSPKSFLHLLPHESKRDQGINTTDAQAGEEKLEGYAHRHCACSGQGMPLSAQIVYSLKSMCLMNTILPLSFFTTL